MCLRIKLKNLLRPKNNQNQKIKSAIKLIGKQNQLGCKRNQMQKNLLNRQNKKIRPAPNKIQNKLKH